MNKYVLIISLFIITTPLISQGKYFSKTGKLTFFSEAPLENIEALSKKGIAIFDTSNGEVVARVSINTFDFEKDLMKEHFNENYLESDKYPLGEFKGELKAFKWDEFSEKGKSEYICTGTLSIHGETNKIATIINLELKNGNIKVSGNFKIKLEDYKIKIPKLVFKNIAEEILVSLEYSLEKLEQ